MAKIVGRSKTHWAVPVLTVVISILICSTSFADIIHLKQGGRIEGRIIKETEKKVVIEMRGGTIEFSPDEIKKIEKKPFRQTTQPTAGRQSKDKTLIEYKGRKYTKERFDNIVKMKGLVKHNGKWMTKHEVQGLKLAKGGSDSSVRDIVAYASPAVVSLTVDNSRIGSGVFISPDGIILTNWHVIADAKKIKVKLYRDEGEYRGRVASSKRAYDLALVGIGGSDHPYLKLADSDEIRVGDEVIAIGNPFGLAATSSTGILSAIRKLKDFPGADRVDLLRWQEEITLIQTDAAVNPGNSGGPLLNKRGQIVGINTFGIPKVIAEGLNFAVHAKEVKKVYSYYLK